MIFNAEEALANATGLTKGDYKFNLTVFDGAGNNNTASVGVIVKQDTNAAPVARAGPDFTVSLPTTQVSENQPFISIIQRYRVTIFCTGFWKANHLT